MSKFVVTKKLFKDMSTGRDGESYDVIRILALLSVVIALALTVYVVVYKDKPFNMQDYGLGIGILFASVGAALRLKETTEPGQRKEERSNLLDQNMTDKEKEEVIKT